MGEAVKVAETNRTGTINKCAANEWCTVTMDDDGTIETYRAPQLLRKERVAVPFDPASSGELMLQRDEDTAQITSETRRRKKRWVVALGGVALAAVPPVRAAVAPFFGAVASKARPVVAAVVSKLRFWK